MRIVFVSVVSLFFLGALLAQDITNCATRLEALYSSALAACNNKPGGYFCNGGLAPLAEPVGPVSNSLAVQGASVDVAVVDSIHPPSLHTDGGGIVWMRSINPELNILLLGDVILQDQTNNNLSWQTFTIETGTNTSTCNGAPANSAVLQNQTPGIPAEFTVNGVSLSLDGTILVQTDEAQTVFVQVEGTLQASLNGQTVYLISGQQITVPLTATPTAVISQPAPFDPIRVNAFPVRLLDRFVMMPQSGYVITDRNVNLRSGPSLGYDIMLEVPQGQLLSVLGRNPTGDWYHVRLPAGVSGWMFGELLQRQHGEISAVYSQTPPPQIILAQETTISQGLTLSAVVMRVQPFASEPAILAVQAGQQVTLLAKSPYNAWVKVDAAGTIGWIPLVTVETDANLDTLSLDHTVQSSELTHPPAPPTATLIPGAWGGAFPDPNCGSNC